MSPDHQVNSGQDLDILLEALAEPASNQADIELLNYEEVGLAQGRLALATKFVDLLTGLGIVLLASLLASLLLGGLVAICRLIGGIGGILTGIVGTAVIFVVLVLLASRLDDPGHGHMRDQALVAATRLLPTDARQNYLEEWQAWLWDLREEGASRYRRLIEMLSLILVAAPFLSVQLRWTRRRMWK
jgi:hypothetical protein